MIQAKEIQLVDIDSLVLNPKNNNKHPKEQIERLAKLIQYQGFRNPVVVSKRTGFVLAGHGRIEAAKMAGLKEVPAMFQDFESEAQEYAYLTSDNAIASWAELDLSAINTEMLDLGPDFDIDLLGIKDFVIDLNEAEDEKYTRKVESPIYEVRGEKPTLPMLYDTETTDALLKEIEDSSLPFDVKLFLKLAAHRHTKFNYKNIAEYYAHASPEEQNLMEKSALVVIDFDKAIELGFVKLTEDMREAYKDDHE
jgi:hypothetical protein